MQPSVEEIPRWWLWPTVLSLDAPVVVVLWQRVLAKSARVGAGPTEMFVLGCSVWLAYSADRWFEGWRLAPGRIQTHRHHFHQKWRWPIAVVWVMMLALDIAASSRGLSPRQLKSGSLLLVPVAAYLLSHQLVHRTSRWRAPKEICVALLLGCGAAVFSASRPGAQIEAMVVPTALFVLLCFTNCALISVWEAEVDRAHGQTSLATEFEGASRLIRALPWALSALSAGAWLAAGAPAAAAAACAAVSGVLLGLVNLAQGRIGRIPARVLADVALMTPIAPFLLHMGS